MGKVWPWFRQLFCSHSRGEWTSHNEVERNLVVTVTQGGCVNCEKKFPPREPPHWTVWQR